MSTSYRERYRPSPHLAGAVVGTFGLLVPALATWGGWTSPLPIWLVLLSGAAGLGFAAWTAVLALRCHTALLADADGLRLHTAGGPRRSEQLTIPWAQIREIRQGEVDTVLYLEVVRTAGAPPVPAAFSRAVVAPGSGGAADHALLAIRDWIPDRTRLADLASSFAPRVRFGKGVPATLARMEEDREIDRSALGISQWGPVSPGTLRFLLRYMGGGAAWLLFGLSLLGFWSDLSAHLGHGRPGVWTAGPVSCGKDHSCFVRGEFVPDDGHRARGDLALHDDSTLYPAGYRVRVRDTGSLDYVYLPGDRVGQWPPSLAKVIVSAVPLGAWLWLVPVRAARAQQELTGRTAGRSPQDSATSAAARVSGRPGRGRRSDRSGSTGARSPRS